MGGEELAATMLAEGIWESMLVTYIEPTLGPGQITVQPVHACWQGQEEIAALR